MSTGSDDAGGLRGSVVIAARDEAAVIERSLTTLFAGLVRGSLDVVLACDGCTDGTAEIARGLGLELRVLDLPPLGKAAALRAAEATTASLPRVYLDADVELAGSAAMRVVEVLRAGAIAARPPVRFRTDGASWLVRRYYAARSRVRSIASDLCGAGVYGLSADARSRFDQFPDLTADDLFAARIVSTEEVTIVDCEPVVVTTPRSSRALVRVLARVYRGNRELSEQMPQLGRRPSTATLRALLSEAARPSACFDAAVYVGFALIGRLAARFPDRGWERDETSRIRPIGARRHQGPSS